MFRGRMEVTLVHGKQSPRLNYYVRKPHHVNIFIIIITQILRTKNKLNPFNIKRTRIICLKILIYQLYI